MIKFETQDVEMPISDVEAVKSWIEAVAESHGYTVHRLSYLFCSDDEMLAANRRYLGHDYYTDIITFDYTLEDMISGDMIISTERTADNACVMGCAPERELLRVVIHGVLHLCGINDKAPGEREIMEANEDAALRLWDENFSRR